MKLKEMKLSSSLSKIQIWDECIAEMEPTEKDLISKYPYKFVRLRNQISNLQNVSLFFLYFEIIILYL